MFFLLKPELKDEEFDYKLKVIGQSNHQYLIRRTVGITREIK